jgi:hypothetical protein
VQCGREEGGGGLPDVAGVADRVSRPGEELELDGDAVVAEPPRHGAGLRRRDDLVEAAGEQHRRGAVDHLLQR